MPAPEPVLTEPWPTDPPPEPAPGEAEWDDLLLSAFGPRHWNLGCG
jgi:hypothetical protein